MHTVVILALDGVIPSDLGIACDAFSRAQMTGGKCLYRVYVCGEHRRIWSGHFEIRVESGLEALHGADTIVIPGIDTPTAPISPRVLNELRAAAKRGCRIASICSGAFVLAATGLLDGARATTHWLAASQLKCLYPKVEVDPNVLFVDNGQILTSAGASAGLDLCLHMIATDWGTAVAADSARLAVAPLVRNGGQAQYVTYDAPVTESSLHVLTEWIAKNLHSPLSLDVLATASAMSIRTLTRRFHEHTGMSPQKWVHTARVRRAQQLLETTDVSIERVATITGFGSATAFRERFLSVVGTSPTKYRKTFRATEITN